MDDISYLDPETIGGTNLYAYCLNNPVMCVDPTGNSAILIGLIIGAIVGATIGFGTAVYVDYSDDGQIFNGSVAWYNYLGATVTGGILGAAIGAGIGYIAPAISSFMGSTFTLGYVVTTSGEAIAISVSGAQLLGIAAGLAGIIFMSKPNSGRIRFNDGTGIDPSTGKEFIDPDEARNFYKTIKDAIKKAKWKKWLKGKGWYGNHLK